MNIKKLREKAGMTQAEASLATGIPLRTYVMYENDPKRIGTIKYEHILETLKRITLVDEDHGVLSLDEIKKGCAEVFDKYEVDYAILFGSYARNDAGERSDVDLVVSCKARGLAYFGLIEDLREKLSKKVDLLNLNQLINNEELLNNILKEGVRIYGKG